MTTRYLSILCVPALFVLAGCGNDQSASTDTTAVDTPPPGTVDTGHVHPTEGPHHGDLVELGNEEYHAEVVHDDESVTIYVLDGHVENAVPIDAAEITINLKHDGQPEQFTLAASPDEGDPEGKSSRFVSNDAELVGHLDKEGSDPQLSLMIDGRPFTGRIEHSHDGHDHSHD